MLCSLLDFIMKRIIFVPFIGAFGGVERLILSLASHLNRSGQEHAVLCFHDTIGLEKHANWTLDVVQLKPARSNVAEARALAHYFKDSKLCVFNRFLIFDLKGAFYAGMAGLKGFVLHLTDPPSLLTVESSRFSASYQKFAGSGRGGSIKQKMIGEVVHRVNRRGVRRAAKVIAMTHCIEAELNFLYGVHPVVIRPGVSEAQKNDWVKPHCMKNQFRILSVSRLEPSKRLDEVIKTLSELRDCSQYSGVTWEVDFAGAGPALDDLRELARSLELSDQIRFHGRVSDQELEVLFSQSDLFIMPAVQGYGLPALEALIRNVPVILHQDSGVSEILGDTPWAQIVADCSQLAPALIQMRSRIEAGQLDAFSKPMIPLDVQWSGQIANECGWDSEFRS